ncbi:hypothetical protein HAX54_018009, partial [Datura stramonium]|nr:hypothetical protein [Datura stramonium]
QQNSSTESQKSKTPSQQAKFFQQSKHDTRVNFQNLNVPTTEQCAHTNRHLFGEVQESTNSIHCQTAQVDISERKGEGLKRRNQQEGRNIEGIGTNFIVVAEQAGLTVSPLQVHESPPRECTLNSIPAMLEESDDEYRVIHSEDEFDQDSQSIGDQDVEYEEEEEASEQPTRTVGPSIDSEQQKEIHQATIKQGLSPRKHQVNRAIGSPDSGDFQEIKTTGDRCQDQDKGTHQISTQGDEGTVAGEDLKLGDAAGYCAGAPVTVSSREDGRGVCLDGRKTITQPEPIINNHKSMEMSIGKQPSHGGADNTSTIQLSQCNPTQGIVNITQHPNFPDDPSPINSNLQIKIGETSIVHCPIGDEAPVAGTVQATGNQDTNAKITNLQVANDSKHQNNFLNSTTQIPSTSSDHSDATVGKKIPANTTTLASQSPILDPKTTQAPTNNHTN